MKAGRQTLFPIFVLALLGCARAKDPQQGLSISAIQRADCTPATDAAVYHFIASRTDGTVLPAGSSLLSLTTLKADDRTFQPFYAGPFGADSRPRLTLMLLDVSGSMAGKSFTIAKGAASRFLKDFNPALDRIAIAPFGSREVAKTIAAARFAATRDDAAAAIAAIPPPRSDANTALYSAVSAGLDALAAEAARTAGDPQTLLIVLTDGKNDIGSGDRAREPGLLEGSAGLSKTLEKLRTSRVQTFTIGFGRREQVNEADLKALGRGETRIVQSADQLESVFLDARRMATNSVLMAFALPGAAHPSGRDMPVSVSINLPAGAIEGTGLWSAPQFSPGLPEGVCGIAERQAAMNLVNGSDNDLIHTLIVFVVIGAILALAWLVVPRMIWNDYAPQSYRPAAPAGHSDGGGGRPRGTDDPTQAVPRSDRSRYQR